MWLSTRGTAWRYANIVATKSEVSEAPRLSSQRWVWKRPLLGTVLRSEQGSRKCRNFFRSSDSILRCLPASGRSGHCEIFFFFSLIKLAPASQTGNLLPELFSNMVLLAKADKSVSLTLKGPVYTDFIFTASFQVGRGRLYLKVSR